LVLKPASEKKNEMEYQSLAYKVTMPVLTHLGYMSSNDMDHLNYNVAFGKISEKTHFCSDCSHLLKEFGLELQHKLYYREIK